MDLFQRAMDNIYSNIVKYADAEEIVFISYKKKDKQEVKETLAKLKQEGLYPYKMPWWQLRDKNLAGGFKNKLFCLFFPFKWYVKLMAKIFRKKAKK